MSKLVIVESPAKAKTIKRFLGKNYNIQASFGHIRDLPQSADEIPKKYKEQKWARFGVNIEGNFEPIYVVPKGKEKYVQNLKDALKGATELLLATDEDREGESISWHVLELLKPNKDVTIKRIVFHEITPEAITEALKNPRTLDENLVKAQEARRILDRLFGYSLSPLLWKKVAPRLSAGRVQSVAVRAVVEREEERRKFVPAEYWDLSADIKAEHGEYTGKLVRINTKKLASGKSFDPDTGQLLDQKALLLGSEEAKRLAQDSLNAKPWKIQKVETKPGKQMPPPPFMTSTLQQEASRKLRYTAKKTMQVAQGLYEGIDLEGERIGLITYMRTDSLTLSERALDQARNVIEKLYGKEYLPSKAVHYKTKSKNAQEAHEAIRPTDLARKPQDVQPYLDKDQYALYELIWKRTLACQMNPARILRTSVETIVQAQNDKLEFHSSGKQIEFPGYLKAYVEGSDDPEAKLDEKDILLPPLQEGEHVIPKAVDAKEHFTRPPARFTEASLIKHLEEKGVGRPSTYATILSTVQDRGYVRKNGNELIPSFTAYAIIQILANYFNDLVNLGFTAKMENDLDEISHGRMDYLNYLSSFYRGNELQEGLQIQIDKQTPKIPFPQIAVGKDEETSQEILVKIGRSGAFLQRGEGGKGNTAPIPEDLAPAELNIEKAKELLSSSQLTGQQVGVHELTGRKIHLKSGPYGQYFELAQTDEEIESKIKPKRISLPKGATLEDFKPGEIQALIDLPRHIGKHPETNEDILALFGPYGPYLQSGTKRARLTDWRDVLEINLETAIEKLETLVKKSSKAKQEKEPIKDFGEVKGASGAIRLLEGRYGPYVTDGKVNASLPKDFDVNSLTPEKALELIQSKQTAPTTKKKFRKK